MPLTGGTRHAECNSAIQQIANLRYVTVFPSSITKRQADCRQSSNAEFAAEKRVEWAKGLAPLTHRLVFGCELRQEGAQARRQRRGIAVFGANVQVKTQPLLVVPTLVCRHLSLIQPPLQGGRYVCGNLLPGNDFR
jgi:hypothetical protein